MESTDSDMYANVSCQGPCNPNPCKNDGECEVTATSRRGDTFNNYICKCQSGFEGVNCQISEYNILL